MNNIIREEYLAAEDCVKKLHKLQSKATSMTSESQEQMTTYYNTAHV
jgi:hypothetical protein